jgi:hypothetical protein
MCMLPHMTTASCWQFWRLWTDDAACSKFPLHSTVTAVISPCLRCVHLVMATVMLHDLTVDQVLNTMYCV